MEQATAYAPQPLARRLPGKGLRLPLVLGNKKPATLDVDGLEVIELPAVRARDAHFKELIDENGQRIDKTWCNRRANLLLDIYQDIKPDIILTESFPLGRRKFAFELLPLLDRAKAEKRPPLIAGSIRDILVVKEDPAKDRALADMALNYFDLLLAHTDPAFITPEATFPHYDELAPLITCTGFIKTGTRTQTGTGNDGKDEIIVSCGGGAVGLKLLKTAIKTCETTCLPNNWRLLVGNDIDEPAYASLKLHEDKNLVIERARPDFPVLLTHAALSISQAGYNTVLDVLQAGVKAIFVPFTAGDENEQQLRAGLLQQAKRGLAIDERELTPATLARAMEKVFCQPPSLLEVDLNGAEKSAEILLQKV